MHVKQAEGHIKKVVVDLLIALANIMIAEFKYIVHTPL